MSSGARERSGVRFLGMPHAEAGASEDGYDVFISFCGADTRSGFTGFLYRELKRQNLRVFLDEDNIQVGEEIDKIIPPAIDNSQIYIPVISKSYPKSKWCLMELRHMMNNVSKSNGRKRIFPIFYEVEPEDVKHQPPHTENLSPEVELGASEALAKVGKIKGWKIKKEERQDNLVHSVRQKVLKELDRKPVSLPITHPIEPDDLTESFENLLNCTVKGRGSLSRGNTEIGGSSSRTSSERKRTSINADTVDGMRLEGSGSMRTGDFEGTLVMGKMEKLSINFGD